jgi:hypothetical protein
MAARRRIAPQGVACESQRRRRSAKLVLGSRDELVMMNRLVRGAPFIWSSWLILALALVTGFAQVDATGAIVAWVAGVLLVTALVVGAGAAIGRRARRR